MSIADIPAEVCDPGAIQPIIIVVATGNSWRYQFSWRRNQSSRGLISSGPLAQTVINGGAEESAAPVVADAFTVSTRLPDVLLKKSVLPL
jgi:hypothetical protein